MKFISFLLILVTAIVFSESRNEICYLPIESGMCYAYLERYAYDVAENRCKKFVFGGCQGNENKFDSLEECLAACYD
ncbi:trypsin inhibitor-like [Anticarsia gemmatalis]|uniref:trypsin inhibitor-like n=1 Tax=Anticarsia gemmatalis TaxID=129554 RepID=UPI003F75D5C5